jgi:hypothetical protein
MVCRLVLAIVLGVFVGAGAVAEAAVDPAIACKEKKAKATGKKASDLMKAFGKNIKKSNAAKLATDISKAQSKFTKAFTKAESGSCKTSGDSGAIEAKVDALVFNAIGSVSPVCGDNIKAPDEDCDGADDAACPGKCGGLAAAAVCGDNTVSAAAPCTCPVEECDGADDSACPGLCTAKCRGKRAVRSTLRAGGVPGRPSLQRPLRVRADRPVRLRLAAAGPAPVRAEARVGYLRHYAGRHR